MKPLGHRVLRFTFIACFGVASLLSPLAEAVSSCSDRTSQADRGHASVADDSLSQPLVAVLLEGGSYVALTGFDSKPSLLPIAVANADGLTSGKLPLNRICGSERVSAGDTLSLVDNHIRLQI